MNGVERKLTVIETESVRCSLRIGCPVEILHLPQERFGQIRIKTMVGFISATVDFLYVDPDHSKQYSLGLQLDRLCDALMDRRSTEVKDKTGREIFEGDICEFNQNVPGFRPGICKIVFFHGAFPRGDKIRRPGW
jgi:hypothetical protein